MSPAANTPHVTEGPWVAENGTTTGRRVIAPNAPKTRRIVAHVPGQYREGNSALLAAAPEMLAVCREIDDAVKAGYDNPTDLLMHLLRGAELARAAIAKAEGPLT